MKVDFYRHPLGASDAESIATVLDTPFLTTGAVNRQVEELLRGYFALPHAMLTNSWTNGAVAVLLAMDIGPGDEVIVPAASFIATANAVELTGARAVFADADAATLLVTPALIAPHVTARTRAVIPVHMYGQMCDVVAIREMLDAHPKAGGRIALIEDAAHCFEGARGGVKPGQRSDAAVFSFYATKNVTCGEGGAIVTGNADLDKRIRETRLHGMSAIAVDRFRGGRYNHWDMKRLGTKANLPDILAALLPAQIETIDARLPRRRAVAQRYRDAFTGTDLRLIEQLPDCLSAEHIFPIGVGAEARDLAIEKLNDAGVPITVNYRSIPGTTYYRERYGDLTGAYPVSHGWGLETLTLPLYPDLAPAAQDHVIETVLQHVCPHVSY